MTIYNKLIATVLCLSFTGINGSEIVVNPKTKKDSVATAKESKQQLPQTEDVPLFNREALEVLGVIGIFAGFYLIPKTSHSSDVRTQLFEVD